ncbi:MAG: hypothetical protein KDD65_05925 [Bacteroidetes bacterium]|nr:hypothetical protein [Bacteroidota bacterium]
MTPSSLNSIKNIVYPAQGHPVQRTAAEALAKRLGLAASEAQLPGDGVRVFTSDSGWDLGPQKKPSGGKAWVWARVDASGNGEITASEPAFVYGFVHRLLDGLTDEQANALESGLLIETSFSWHRPIFDTTLTQVGRTARKFDPEAHIEQLARCGFTHVEVNALHSHLPDEPGVATEYYPQFYSYCSGFNHFVDSKLTRGLYPIEYISANLNRLKKYAAIGRKYGLKPGMLTFEPRTMPEALFVKYPTLRGARVDHPFRSHLPRYCLAQDHPMAREHYREVMSKLMEAVPELSYISVWTNDSGAGFEHTASLYVGRNGGPYMIREWRNHEAIAKAAGKSAVSWLRLIRDTAAKTNPEFEVCLRIEPFKVEHDTIIEGMGDGVTIEAPSLLVRGYELPYEHPKYSEQKSAAGSIFHTDLDPKEKDYLADYRQKGVEPKLHYSCGSSFNVEPLMGIPFPRMLYKKLKSLKDIGATAVNAFGGLLNEQAAPYWPNPEIIRGVQFNPDATVDELLQEAATRFVGAEHADKLVKLWDAIEEGISYMPILPLYSHFGFCWYRAWVRPFTPNLEAVPAHERDYFQRFMVTVFNNPVNNDLGRDVLFELINEDDGRKMTGYFDDNVFPRYDAALRMADELIASNTGEVKRVFQDLRDRTVALKCWATTQRNTTAWVAGVHGYLRSEDPAEKKRLSQDVQDMIDLDLENTRTLLNLWNTSETEFMLVSGVGETSFVYGENLGENLQRKIELTEKYRHCEPYIDKDILWRLQ